jgi:LAO/AO transport system kinase
MSTVLSDLVGAVAGDAPGSSRAAARLMTLLADDPSRLPELFQAAASLDAVDAARLTLPRLLIGITGAPGSGKSTLTDAIIREFRRQRPGTRIGVIAVDPSSPFTGGAVLGDRVRMMRHATDPMVFVRSMASRGHLGGLALGVKGVVRVMGLLGCETVIIETVGVGQSEVEVAGVADLVMIVLAPGLGDSVQLLKAGLMEIGDLFVVNKADRPGAERLHGDLLAMLHASQADPTGHHGPLADDAPAEDLAPWLSRRPGTVLEPETFLVSAERGEGIAGLAERLHALGDAHGGSWQLHRQQAIEAEVLEAVIEEATRRLREAQQQPDAAKEAAAGVLRGALSVEQAASLLLSATAKRTSSDS